MGMFETYKQRLKTSYNACQPHWDRMIDDYKHYLSRLDVGQIDPNAYPFQSRMTVPVSYEIVETVLPRMIGKDPEFGAVALETDDVPFEQVAKMVIESQYNNPKLELLGEPIYLKLVRGTKEKLITGNVVYRPYWRREYRKRVTWEANLKRAGINKDADITKVLDIAKKMKAEKEVSWSKKVKEVPFLDDFDMRHVPFFHFFPDLDFAEPGRMRYKIERDYMTFEELAEEATIFGYDATAMAEIKEKATGKEGGFTPEITKDFHLQYNDLFQNVNQQISHTDDDKIHLLMVDKMWMGDTVAVFVNEKWNLTGDEGMPNPYDVMMDPFVYGNDVVLPHSYFSYGEIYAIKKLEDGVTDLMNMRFDNLIQSMLNFWVYNPNYMADGEEFVPVPNSLTAVTDVDRAVRMLSGKDVTPTAYKEAEELMGIVSRVTGTNDYVKGEEGSTLAGRTYGGLRLVQEAANARFIVKSRLFEKLTLKALGYFMLEMPRQFWNKDRIVRLTGESGEPYDTEIKVSDLKQIKGFMDIKVTPNSSVQIDQQAEAMKLKALGQDLATEKGPYAGIPENVYDRFLLRQLEANGITDAPYWIREIKKARAEAKKEEKKVVKEASEASAGVLPPGLPGMAPAIPGPADMAASMPMLQPDGNIGMQPDPSQMLAGVGAMPPSPLANPNDPTGQF